jgi:hypothetical protein
MKKDRPTLSLRDLARARIARQRSLAPPEEPEYIKGLRAEGMSSSAALVDTSSCRRSRTDAHQLL